ncbi:hypothetical protein [Variovorax sp. OV700]|uniref:glycine-rich domain-containing protein n=1 Tax=Variovorax sp. OV700 TaxID=1882826 RepID=UPI000887D2AD|nr:hypothetical protein [Variovorax sp. OV700]SDI78064.1 hypothetical protein SAMN05444748_107116 [Variovorax sp. OV700]
MANLNETDLWEPGIYQLEEDDPVLGGPTGIDNLSPRQLASRSRYQRLRNVTPWAADFAYPVDAYVSEAGKTWKSVVASTGVVPGSDPAKWIRWAHTEEELAAALDGSVAAHEAKADPHAQYATDVALAAASFGRLLAVQRFTAPGLSIYTPTPGTSRVVVEVQGAGASGGSAPGVSNTAAAALSGGGGGGGYALALLLAGFAGVTVTVGAGGAPAAVGASAGNAGGTSSFGALISAPGGVAGLAGGVAAVPCSAGGGNLSPQPSGGNILSLQGGPGAFAIAASYSNGSAANGGVSRYGIGGQTAPGLNGSSGFGFGSGGSGVMVPGNYTAGLQGGSGAQGIVIVWEYA